MQSAHFTRCILLLISMAALGLAPLHAQVTTPGLFKHLKGQKDKGLQVKVVMSAKQIGIGLFSFENDHGQLPDEKTAKSLGKGVDDGVELAADSANDCFFQLIVGGYLDDPAVFSPERKEHEKRDNVDIKKLKHCFFSYIPAADFDHGDRPMVVAPLVKDKKVFDPKPLGGKAVVMLSDISVHLLDIDEDGVVKLKGKDLFDPEQPYWEGKKPEVKWPEN